MRNVTRTRQQGLTLTGLLFGGVILILLVILGMKVVPDVIEYQKIVSNVKAIVQDPILRTGPATDIRAAFDRRANINQISTINSSDIEISGSGNSLVISFAYRKEIPLFRPVSLAIDFQYSTR
jgi:Tfp pilus assembly protein FimT